MKIEKRVITPQNIEELRQMVEEVQRKNTAIQKQTKKTIEEIEEQERILKKLEKLEQEIDSLN